MSQSQTVGIVLDVWGRSEKSVVFASYLGAQVDSGVHTHQYYRTAKYESDRTIGGEDG